VLFERTKLKYFIAVQIVVVSLIFAQNSPHGELQNKCIDCHSTEGWKVLLTPMKFDHSKTPFVLYGRHRDVLCDKCHTGLRFTETPTNCVSCHQRDFDNALVLNHRVAGFSTDCSQCHDERMLSWESSFSHDKLEFRTHGIHEAVACNQCHLNGIYKGTSSECVACHLKEFTAATNPSHSAAGFSTDCATCHRALTWQPAVFYPHGQYFPISAGDTHSPGRWNSCTDCHTAGPPYTTFECINCHEHSKSATDRHHDDVSGYVYQSSACYRCHSQGGR
jgi:hypothetical protein